MLTALSVNVPEKAEGLRRLANRLRRDRVEVQVSRARGVSLRHITYTSYSGEVRLPAFAAALLRQAGFSRQKRLQAVFVALVLGKAVR